MKSLFRNSAIAVSFAVALALFSILDSIGPAQAAPQYTATHRTNAMTDIVTAASTTAFLCIYNGTEPANVAAGDGNTLLVAMPMANPIGTVTTGVLTMSAITSTAAAASGTASHFRIATSSACTTVIVQGTVSTSSADLNFAGGVAWTSGETISISSFTLTANGA